MLMMVTQATVVVIVIVVVSDVVIDCAVDGVAGDGVDGADATVGGDKVVYVERDCDDVTITATCMFVNVRIDVCVCGCVVWRVLRLFVVAVGVSFV